MWNKLEIEPYLLGLKCLRKRVKIIDEVLIKIDCPDHNKHMGLSEAILKFPHCLECNNKKLPKLSALNLIFNLVDFCATISGTYF